MLFFLFALAGATLPADGWEWQFALGPWTLRPLAPPAERRAERIVRDEVSGLLAPLLQDFAVAGYAPRITMRSRGGFLGAGLWRRLAAERLALGLSAAWLRFDLPFSLRDEQRILFQGLPLATVTTSGEGRIRLRTFMLTAQGRWRVLRRGRFAAHAQLGLALLRFRGDLHLPLSARVDSLFGSVRLDAASATTLGALRRRNRSVPAWLLSPSLGAEFHYRVGKREQFFVNVSLSQGTFLSAGLALGR